MDDNNRRRRQTEGPQYPSANPRYTQDAGQERSFVGGSDRYRSSLLSTTSPATSRGIATPSSGYGYYPDSGPASTFATPLSASGLQYQTEYTPEQRQQQSTFTSYNPNMMYGVNQPSSQNAVYESAQSFQSRQPTGMQMLSDVTAPYYGSEPTNPPGATVLQHQSSSSSTTVYQQSPADRSTILQNYPSSMIGIGGIPQQGQAAAEVIEEQQSTSGNLNDAYAQYQTALRQIFENIIGNLLVEASQAILEVSEWLLAHVGELGLTIDEQSLHDDRIKLWNDFNHAWLALLQKQKDLTLELLQSGISPRTSQTLISYEFLEKMGKELTRLCDDIEKHGLVDYQYGVWEEPIIIILMECLDLLKPNDGESGEASSNPTTSNPGVGRTAA